MRSSADGRIRDPLRASAQYADMDTLFALRDALTALGILPPQGPQPRQTSPTSKPAPPAPPHCSQNSHTSGLKTHAQSHPSRVRLLDALTYMIGDPISRTDYLIKLFLQVNAQ